VVHRSANASSRTAASAIPAAPAVTTPNVAIDEKRVAIRPACTAIPARWRWVSVVTSASSPPPHTAPASVCNAVAVIDTIRGSASAACPTNANDPISSAAPTSAHAAARARRAGSRAPRVHDDAGQWCDVDGAPGDRRGARRQQPPQPAGAADDEQRARQSHPHPRRVPAADDAGRRGDRAGPAAGHPRDGDRGEGEHRDRSAHRCAGDQPRQQSSLAASTLPGEHEEQQRADRAQGQCGEGRAQSDVQLPEPVAGIVGEGGGECLRLLCRVGVGVGDVGRDRLRPRLGGAGSASGSARPGPSCHRDLRGLRCPCRAWPRPSVAA
jgi:hypothetical protein